MFDATFLCFQDENADPGNAVEMDVNANHAGLAQQVLPSMPGPMEQVQVRPLQVIMRPKVAKVTAVEKVAIFGATFADSCNEVNANPRVR